MPADPVSRAATFVEEADGLIVTAGAGIGVDSGLPDFRGGAGFWGAYPALGRAGIRFEEIASPDTFHHDPELAWGFYGHRLALYRRTVPHAGFAILREIGARLPGGAFVYTSNVDGQFQEAGFDPGSVLECHGSIHHLQCLKPCGEHIWPADAFEPAVDEERCRLVSPLPLCRKCGTVARPNILMFGDWSWLDGRTALQGRRWAEWRAGVRRPVVIEVGAGTAIPSARRFGEEQGCPLVRINPVEASVPARGVALRMGGLAGLAAVRGALEAIGWMPHGPDDTPRAGE